MQRLRKMKGFTLIELIVVVIIIGILAAVSAIAYNSFVEKSRKNAVLADARNAVSMINGNAADKTADGKASSFIGSAAAFTAANTGLPATKVIASTAATPKYYAVDTNVKSGSPLAYTTKVWCEIKIADVATVTDADCTTTAPALLP